MNLNRLQTIIYKYTNVLIEDNINNIYDNTLDLSPNSILVIFNPNSTNLDKYKNNILSHILNIEPAVTLFIDGSEKHFNNLENFNVTINITNEILENIINEYYCESPKEIIGVTGSCGKTSSCIFLYELLKKMNVKSVLITTIKIDGIKNNFNIRNTTPSWITIKQILHNAYEENINIAIVEVSSHGIKNNRIKNINFTSGIWSNFNMDHMELHGTIEDYFNTKKQFIESLPVKIVNENVNKYREDLKITGNIITYGVLTNNINDNGFTYNNINYNKPFNVKFFQHENLVGGMILLYNLGYKNIFNYSDINILVPSRMEFFGETLNGSLVYSDGAYRPENINKVIDYFKLKNLKKMILVVGAGGSKNRGIDYRKNIGLLSKEFFYFIVTDDNPRNENPVSIRNEIIGDNGDSNNIINIGNRYDALNYAFKLGVKNTIILIISHGSDETVLYKNHYVFMSDKDIYNDYIFQEKLKELKF